LTLHKADFGTRAAWASGVFHAVGVVIQVTQGTADKVTEIATEFRRPHAVPVHDLRPVEGQSTAVASTTFHLDAESEAAMGNSHSGRPASESLEWVYAYRISEGDPFQKVYESVA